MAVERDTLRALASEIRSLTTRDDSPASRLAAAGRLLIAAIDLGAFAAPSFASFIVSVRQRREQETVNGWISAWVEAVWWLRGKPDTPPDPNGTFAADCELVAAQILESVGLPARTDDDELWDFAADAIADAAGRELIDVFLSQITVPLPPPTKDVQARRLLENTPLTPQEQLEQECRARARDEQPPRGIDATRRVTVRSVADPAAAEGEVTIDVRVFAGRVELDDRDPQIDTLNRDAWDRIRERHGQPVSLRLDQGRPVVTLADGIPIPGQRATRYGRRSDISPADLIDRLARCTYTPQLTDDELARLRAHLKAPMSLSRLQRDPVERSRRAKLKEILIYNDELRKATAAGPGVAAATQPPAAPTPDTVPDAPVTTRQKRAKWLAEAMLLVRDHPDWSDREVARRVGKDPATLSRSQEYRAAARMARGGRDQRTKGYIERDADTGRTDVEAYIDHDEDDE